MTITFTLDEISTLSFSPSTFVTFPTIPPLVKISSPLWIASKNAAYVPFVFFVEV